MKKRKAKYTGELAVPIVLDPYFAIAADLLEKGTTKNGKKKKQIRREKEQWIMRARMEKLNLLFSRFGIANSNNKDAWMALALALAQEHVPGIQIVTKPPAKRGRPRTGPSSRDVQTAVLKMASERGRGISDAIVNLRKRQPKTWGRYSVSKLRNLVYEGSKGGRKRRPWIEKAVEALSGEPHRDKSGNSSP
jgi:hypothetical protein